MMSARRLVFLRPALMLLLSSSAAGQKCIPDDTPLTCWTRFVPDVPPDKLPPVAKETAKTVSQTNTGSPTATTLATAAALRDFLSFFSAGVDTGKVTENGTSVTLDINVPFPFFQDSDRIKFQALFTDPNLADDVQTPLGSKSGAAKDKLTNFDDVTTIVSYSPANRRFGRSIAPHVTFLQTLENKYNSNVANKLQRFAAALAQSDVTMKQDTKFSTITDAAKQKEIIQLVEAAAAAEKEASTQTSSILKALTRLLNNQPQVYVSGGYHYRNPLIGPDEWSVKATYELSPKSLNRFLRGSDDVCGEANLAEDANGQKCAARLVSFAGTEDASKEPDTGNRLAASIEYRQAKGESVDLSEFMITAPIARKRTHSLVYSLTYGQPLTGTALKNTRIDVAVNYQDVSNDPTKKDRLVASLTLSQKISETMTLPLSVTYANHTEYLPQADRHLGVHFGISYKVDASAK